MTKTQSKSDIIAAKSKTASRNIIRKLIRTVNFKNATFATDKSRTVIMSGKWKNDDSTLKTVITCYK